MKEGMTMSHNPLLYFASIGLCFCAFGCGDEFPGSASVDSSQQDVQSNVDPHDHGHEIKGPHGGHVIPLGEGEFLAELTHDESTNRVAVYVLAKSDSKPATGVQTADLQFHLDGDFVSFALEPAENTSQASEFGITDEVLCDLLLHSESVRGRLHVTIDGTKHTGIIDHAAHDHEGHAHGGDTDDGHDHDGHDHGTDEHDHDADEHEGHDHNGDDHDKKES
jgi:hypothetical protein